MISGVLVVIGDDLGKTLNTNEQELITSITSGGAFIGAVLAGLTADKFGRKTVIAWGCFVFSIGAIIMSSSFGLAQMTVGRCIIGFGVGQAAMVGLSRVRCRQSSKYAYKTLGCTNLRWRTRASEIQRTNGHN